MYRFFFFIFGFALGSIDFGSHPRNSSNTTVIGKCPKKDDAETVLLPDLEDCSIFYKCEGGSPIKLHCQSGMEWDFDNYECVTRKVGMCEKLKSKREKFYSPVGICPLDIALISINLPDDYDCSVYYKCSHGFAHRRRCPYGELFDIFTLQCTYAAEAQCFRISNDLAHHMGMGRINKKLRGSFSEYQNE